MRLETGRIDDIPFNTRLDRTLLHKRLALRLGPPHLHHGAGGEGDQDPPPGASADPAT